jgi:hypothetical protein
MSLVAKSASPTPYKEMKMLAFHRFALGTLMMLALFSRPACGDDHFVRNDAEFARALARIKAGDQLLIEAGVYKGGHSRSGLAGTKDRPIVIAAADPKNPPTFSKGQSGLHLRSPAYLEIRDLIFEAASGNGLNIDDGAAPQGAAHDLVLKNIAIKDVGPRGNCDGIKLSGVDHFTIEGCRIEKWGSSGSAIDMVGCHHGIVKNCTFADATSEQANAVQTKGGSSEILIQRCQFQNCGGRGVNAGGSTGLDYFRPKDAPHEAKNITIEDCLFQGGMSAIAFVGVDGAIARHNTIYLPKRWPFRILQENTDARFAPCRNVKVENNLVAFNASDVSVAINIGGNTAAETFQFRANAWCCLDRPSDARRIVKLPSHEPGGVFDFTPKFKDAEKGDFTLLLPAPNMAGARWSR